MFISEFTGNQVRRVSAGTGAIESLAITAWSVSGPRQIFGDTQNNLYLAFGQANKIVLLSLTTLTSSVFAGGGGGAGFNTQATSAVFSTPGGVWKDPVSGNVYASSIAGGNIRQITDNGFLSLLGGTGTSTADGVPATSSALSGPNQLFGDSVGTLYCAMNGQFKIRAIALSTGIITTVAGTSASAIPTSFGGAATSTSFVNPPGVWGNTNGDLFVADQGGARVLKVANGITFI
eukprot:gene47289-biopygen7045